LWTPDRTAPHVGAPEASASHPAPDTPAAESTRSADAPPPARSRCRPCSRRSHQVASPRGRSRSPRRRASYRRSRADSCAGAPCCRRARGCRRRSCLNLPLFDIGEFPCDVGRTSLFLMLTYCCICGLACGIDTQNFAAFDIMEDHHKDFHRSLSAKSSTRIASSIVHSLLLLSPVIRSVCSSCASWRSHAEGSSRLHSTTPRSPITLSRVSWGDQKSIRSVPSKAMPSSSAYHRKLAQHSSR